MSAITYGGKGSINNQTGTTLSASYTLASTCKLFVVGIVVSGTGARKGADPTIGGQAMTQALTTVATSEGNVAFWYKLSPVTGTKTLSFGNGTSASISAYSSWYNCPDALTLGDTDSAFSTAANQLSLSTSIPSNQGNVSIDIMHSGYFSTTNVVQSDTSLYLANRTAKIAGSQYAIKTTGTSEVMSNQTPSTDDMASIMATFYNNVTVSTSQINTRNTVALTSWNTVNTVSKLSLNTINTLNVN